ncbi:PDZ domain-containing protein [Ornithinibacillus bavariensis]|uniref:Membrane protein n=1 Tax=Ornithinibacillus bavariensis TaxID=545502 RepID=A0A919X6G3_9BACI|nr:PDZ domain-containing protein [Ornithinibacillus bavariensis]GIO26416.1 membrane protein [Ornithinibacillus bavariensis]HAM81637.1 PDZ domain-containing protein [Ornithinibacillus sp.]
MLQEWLIEIGKGIGKLFVNPLFYWAIIFIILSGIKRIKEERKYFGTKVFDILFEWKDTWSFSILIGIVYSILIVGFGMVFTYETILILSVVMILLSLSFRFSFLSPSYTIGITYVVLLIISSYPEYFRFLQMDGEVNFIGLAILGGLFLFVEAHFINRVKRNGTFPTLVKGKRGGWVGKHFIKKTAIIPVFLLVPTGLIEPFASYWPYLSFGDEHYALILFPFLLGIEHGIRGGLPHKVAQKLSMSMLGLAMVVFGIAVGSIFIPALSSVSIMVAIVGREWINYRERVKDLQKSPFFNHTNDGLRVLGIIPGSPADRLNILIGETISKVNGIKIQSEEELYEALQQTGSFFKMELFDLDGEIRFVQSAMYEGDHHELGLIFAGEPYRKLNK